MTAEAKTNFLRIKPICDVVMVCPTQESITNFLSRVADLKKEVVQELQQYLLFPFITHLKSKEIEKKYELQIKLVDGMRTVLRRVTVNSLNMCMKIEPVLLQLVFDNSKPGMIAEVPEELKLSVMKCLTVLMLNLDKRFREELFKTQVPLVAQTVFVSVHIAKLEKLRSLRLEAVYCVMAHTMTHPQLMDDKYMLLERSLETCTVDMLASILPGVLAALQDVANAADNPGHICRVTAIAAIHRILCLTMSDRFLNKKNDITAEDFAKNFKETVQYFSEEDNEVSCKEKKFKDVPKRSQEWYRMASDKLTAVTQSLIPLRTHEHFKVRRELAIFCSRVLNECTLTMQKSQPIVLDILISLSKDERPELAEYCSIAVNGYFNNASPRIKHRTVDYLCENFFVMLNGLPRVLNDIDSDRKLVALNLLHGYVVVLCEGRPQRLTAALAHNNMRALCSALAAACTLHAPSTQLNTTSIEMTAEPHLEGGWLRLQHLDTAASVARLREICALLGGADAAHLILDRLLDTFQQERTAEIVCVINWMVTGSRDVSFIRRVLDVYLEDDVWYSPLEAGPSQDTGPGPSDVTVYNPRAWTTSRVPGLYEGTVETRYTGISYSSPRVRALPPLSLRAARRNLCLVCALTAGVGAAARGLGDYFTPYLIRAGAKLLERAGSPYEFVRQSGVQALNDVAAGLGYESVAALIQHNADYFTHQVTVRLKKAWNTQSALEILSVIMEYSDPSLLDFLCGIARDVLVQSCDKYYEHNVEAYLQVFLNFVQCIRRWFSIDEKDDIIAENGEQNEIDFMNDLLEYIKNREEADRLMETEEFEQKTGKTVEEMYKEDLKKREDDVLDYDDKVTEEKRPLPEHISVTLRILKRCVMFVVGQQRAAAALALHTLAVGLPVLAPYNDDLLPLVHQAWGPLAHRLVTYEPVVWRRALDLLVTMAKLARDFIHNRCVKEVMPHLYSQLRKWCESNVKDSSYRDGVLMDSQTAALRALSPLLTRVGVRDRHLVDAMTCVQLYLSRKQPETLQKLAVEFFVAMLNYDEGCTWNHLRSVCDNKDEIPPPLLTSTIQLHTIVGTPYRTENDDIQANIKAIFESNSGHYYINK